MALNIDHLVKSETLQSTINAIVDAGGEAVISHPTFSSLKTSELLKLISYLGLEIFNSSCQFRWENGLSTTHWDELLENGLNTLGFAADDAHLSHDICYSWINVKAQNLTPESVMVSMKEGLFYSSNGPKIFDINIADDVVTIKPSPSKTIIFITEKQPETTFTSMDRKITTAKYRLRGNEK